MTYVAHSEGCAIFTTPGASCDCVDDEMVERGLREMYGDRYIDSLDEDWRTEKDFEMRKILTAALHGNQPRAVASRKEPS